MSVTLPWFEPVPESPAIAEGEPGIELVAPAAVPLEAPASLVVTGVFQLPAKDAADLPREDPFAALTLLVVEEGSARSFALRPARSAVGPETREVPPDFRRGWFQADLFAQARFVPRAGRYFVSAHLAALRSRPAEVRVTARP